MRAQYLAGFLIFLAGVMIPLAVALNARVGQALKSPLLGATAVPIVGAIFCLLLIAAIRPDLPTAENLAGVPWYAWLGGVMVTIYFLIMVFKAPVIGLGFSISLVLAGQLFMSVIIDHFGLLGLPVVPFSLGRLGGAILIISGVCLLKFF